MESPSFAKAALLMLVLVIISFVSWELYLRNKGIGISYDDGKELWADKRAKVYAPEDKATVFIGSSRNKYDLDINTWESMTGDHPIQLAIEGMSPLPVLDDLANDKNFKGKLVIDFTEILFFSTADQNLGDPKERIKYFNDRTPAQRFSFEVNHALEAKLVFLDKDNLSLNALLEKTNIPSRPGVFVMPVFPLDFGRVKFSRQDFMTPRFLSDTNLQNKVKDIWVFFRKASKEPPASGHKLDSIIATVKTDIDKIRARGGKVIFVRTPSSGPFWQGEQMGFPREKYWDRVLQETGCDGIHFKDYPPIANFQCPEFSHLSPSDAIVFTRNLVDILQKEKGWTFPYQSSPK
jgi:hypothetical protein